MHKGVSHCPRYCTVFMYIIVDMRSCNTLQHNRASSVIMDIVHNQSCNTLRRATASSVIGDMQCCEYFAARNVVQTEMSKKFATETTQRGQAS